MVNIGTIINLRHKCISIISTTLKKQPQPGIRGHHRPGSGFMVQFEISWDSVF